MTVNYSGYDVTIIPQGGNGKVKAKQCDDAIVYDEYFGKNASLKYTPLLSGVKEDIILKSYVENASYDFIVETNGLYIYNDDIGYYLVDETNSTIIYYLGDVEVYDAIGKPELGEMKITVLEEGQRYKLTLSVSDTFLSDPETVYPVTIDPTITISDNVTGADSIIDAPIFEAKASTNYAKYKYNTVGTTTASYGIGRTVVKLPGLTSSNEYQTIKADQITSVKFYVRDSSGTGKQTINLYPLTNTTWTETTVKWSNVGSHITDDNYSATLSSGKVTGFDITGLVKYWKTGKYSADAGFILINSTETKNKSFCSSEYGTTSYRPYVEMTYESVFSISKSEADVVEGGTITITAATNPSGQAVTWKIADGSIASISSSNNTECKVRGVKAGKTTLTATMTDAAGVTQTRTCIIYVYIIDGVYTIQNVNSSYYLGVKNSSFSTGASLTQTNAPTLASSIEKKLAGLWKVYYLGKGCYTVRPMHKLDMALDVTGSSLDIRQMGLTDSLSSVPAYGQWAIKWDSNGYVFANDAYTYREMQVENASTNLYANVVISNSTNSNNCRWTLSKVTSPPSGVLLYYPPTGAVYSTSLLKTVAVDETRTLTDLNIAGTVYSGSFINQTIYWESSNEDVATVNKTTGAVTGVSEGTVTITAYSAINSNLKTTYQLEVLPFVDGTYFIKNREFGKYLQINDNDASNGYSTSGSIMEQWSFDSGEYQKWMLTSLDNGYYKITSAESDLALSVQADQASSSDLELVQEAYTGAYRQQWKITETSYGSYKIKARSSEGLEDDLVMAVGDSLANGADGTNIEQRLYKNNTSYMDEWYVCSNRAMLYGVSAEGHDHSSCLEITHDKLHLDGWEQVALRTGSITSNRCKCDLQQVGLFTSRSHGVPVIYEGNSVASSTGIILNDSDSLVGFFSDYWIGISDESTYINTNEDYSNLNLVLFVGCNTAHGGEDGNNLPSKIVEQGAKTAIGFELSIDCNEANIWTEVFYEAMLNGDTVEVAVEAAKKATNESTGLHSVVICGDRNLRLN